MDHVYVSDSVQVVDSTSGETVPLKSAPLLDAVESGNLEMVQLLMERKPRLDGGSGGRWDSEDKTGKRYGQYFDLPTLKKYSVVYQSKSLQLGTQVRHFKNARRSCSLNFFNYA